MNHAGDSIEDAILHHAAHGDMDGKVCLLNRCALHYPERRVHHVRIWLDVEIVATSPEEAKEIAKKVPVVVGPDKRVEIYDMQVEKVFKIDGEYV